MTERGLQASVVMPTHGRRASLLRVLRALGRQRVRAGVFEVVVICDGDVDGSASACRALTPELPYPLRLIEQENRGPAAARNRGVEGAKAPLIIFLDDDVVPDEDFVATHLAAQVNQEARVTIGPLLPPPDARLSAWAAWEEKTLCRQYDDMLAGRFAPTYRQFYTGNASVRKDHIIAAGGFDPFFRRAEDVELARRLHERGLHFVFLPQAKGWHYISRSFASWLRIPTAYGTADVAIARAGRPALLGIVAEEYRGRQRLLRLWPWLCVGRPALTHAVVALLGFLVRGATRMGARRTGHVFCSLIFTIHYYNGVAIALGGRTAFRRLVHGDDITSFFAKSDRATAGNA